MKGRKRNEMLSSIGVNMNTFFHGAVAMKRRKAKWGQWGLIVL